MTADQSKHQKVMEDFCHHLTVMAGVGVARKEQLPVNPSIEQLEDAQKEIIKMVQSWVNECFQKGFSADASISMSYLTAKYNDWMIRLSRELQERKTSSVLKAPKNDAVLS